MVGNDNEFQSEQSKYVNQAVTKPAKSDVKTEGEPTKRKLSKKDYDILLEGAVKSDKKDFQIANILHAKGMSDSDIDTILAERKKKRTPEASPSLGSTGYLQFTETERLLGGAAKGNLGYTDQGIQYDIQKDENNQRIIEQVSYESFLKFQELSKEKLGDAEYDTPNDMFELLVDKDNDYLTEVEPFQNKVNRIDLKIAEELGIKEAYEAGLKKRGSKRSLEESWAPFSGVAASKVKLSKEQVDAIQLVSNTIKERNIPFASDFETDDPAQKAAEIRDKYRAKYGTDFSQIFQEGFKSKIPPKYAEDKEFLKSVEDYMHTSGRSVDLNGDGRIYQRGTAVSRAANQAVLSVFEMGVDIANVIADQTGDEDFKSAVSEVKQQVVNKKSQESRIEYADFSLKEYVSGEGGTAAGLVNKGLSLTAQSLPYMAGIGGIQKAAVKKGLTMLGSKTLAKYTASTVGMGTISAASAYSNGMGQEWFEELNPFAKMGYSAVHGLAEGAGETLSFAVFNKVFAPVFKSGSQEVMKKSITEFLIGGAKAYGYNVSEEIMAESATAVVQTAVEILAKGEEVTWEKLNDRVNEAIEAAILMTGTMQGTAGAARAPFELQSFNIASKLGLADTKLRSRAVIKNLSEEYNKETDATRKGIIGTQLSKALQAEANRNKENAMFFEGIRKQSPQDYATLLEIADSFDKKVEQWNSMEEGAAKSQLGAEIKADFKTKLDIEKKYKDTTAPALGGLSKEVGTIVSKIQQGETLTLEEEQFYAENQAEVEDGFREGSIKLSELYTPLQVDATQEGVTELTEENTDETIDNIINGAETMSDDFFKGFKTTKDGVIRGLQSIKGAIKAIRGVNPDAKVFVHTNGDSFKKATGLKNLARGYYKSGNSIHFLAPAMNSTTGYHESTHGAFMEVLGNKSFDKLFGDISRAVKNSGEGARVGAVISNFVQGYESGDMTEEGVVEFISMLADGQFEVQIEKGILRSIAESLASVLPFNVSIPSRTQGVQIMKDIAKSMQDGTPIDPDKVKSLKKRKDKGQESTNKAQRVLNPRQIEEGDPVYDYLMGLDIVPEDLEWMGSGDFGEAYSDGDGTIVKFTNSNNEFETAQEILAVTGGRKKLVDLAFAEIEDAVEIDGNKIIIMEELDTDGAEELYYELEGMASDAGVPLSEFWIDADEVTEVDGDLIEGLDHLDDIFRAYRALGIFAPDVKGDNLGFGKDGRLKAFDIQERGKSQIIEDIENQVIDTYSEPQSSKLSEQKGKAQAIVMDKASDLIRRNIIDPRTLVGEDIPMALFYDNTRVGESTVKNTIDGYTTKNSFNGGFGYSFRDNAPFQYNGKTMTPVIAVSTEQKASSIIKEILSKKGNLIPLVTQNNLTGHLGNLDTLEELFGESGHFNHAAKKSPEAMDSIVAGLKSAVQSAVDFAGASTVKADLKKALSSVNLDEINTVNDFREVVLKGAINSFGRRNAFFKEYLLLKKRGKKATKSTTQARALAYEHGIPTMQELADGITEQAFSNTELGDVVAFIRPERKAVIYTDLEEFKDKRKRKNNKGFEYEVIYAPDLSKHSSYPFVIVGENVGFPSSYIDVTSIFPDLEGISKKTSYYGAGRRADNAPTGAVKDSAIEHAAAPTTDPLNQYHKLSSTPEGKAQIIGELGAMASGKLEQNLLMARDLEKQGRDKENIFFATGWYRGMDNLWRSEINYGFINRQFLKNIEEGVVDLSVPYRVKMKEAMDAKGLYELYPSLADYTLSIEPISGTTLGYHDSEMKTIAISRDDYFERSTKGGYKMRKKQKVKSDYSKDFRGFMNTLYHEIQHAVQSIEGFTDGYNQNRIAYDARSSKKRTEKTSIDQLKDANALTRKLVEAKREKIDLYDFAKQLGKLAGQDVDEYGWSMSPIEDVNFKNVFGFINSTGDIKQAVEQYREGLKFFAPRGFGSETTSAIYIAGRQGQNLSDSNLLLLKKLRSDAKKLYENNKKAFELAGAMQDFARKNMQGSYGLMYLNERAIEESLKEVSRVAYGATVNASRFGKVKSSLFGGFERSPSSFEVYQRNLGEAEARLVGRRGTTKQKDRMPVFSEMHPDVASTEIWIAPPASIITAIEENRVEIARQELAEEALDQQLMAQDERDDAEKAIQERKDIAKKAMDILYEKMVEQMEVSQEKGKRKKGKAQLIEGTTSHSIQKKEVQEALIKAGIDGFVESGTGVNRLFEHLRFKFADKYRPLQNLQTAIEKAKGEVERSETNFRRAEALMHGKASEDARLFEENILKPLMDTMIKYNVSNEQLSEYLYALHAYERNEFVKNTIDPANEAGSGMTNEVAEEIKKKYEGNKEQMDELSEMFYKITEGTRKTMLDFGLITKAQYDSFGMFEHYVPLVGTAVTPTSDLFDFEDSRSRIDSGKGGGIAVFGKEYKSVSGRYSEAQSPLESAVANYMRTISRARKNEVLQTLLNLTQENTDNRAWEVFTEENPDMKVRLTSNGQSIFIEEATGEEYEYSLRKKFAAVAMAGNPDYVPVKVEGRTSYIKFNDSRITRVLNNGGVGKTSAFVKGLSVASRYFTKVFTSYNPEFIVANLTRDVQTALFNQMAEQNMELSNISGESFVTQTLGGIKNAVRAVYQFERGKRDKMDSEMRGYYEEYLSSGAKTDWFFLKTPAEIEADMVDYIQSVSPITNQSDLRGKAKAVGVKGKAKMKDIAKYVDDVNSSIENGVRFSAYVQARRNGVDADKAAEFSKELTINFNRSGEMGALANSIFLFFNASVQGSTRLMRSLVKSKKARAVAGGLSAMSALITMMNMAVGGEDEDGIPYYEKIPSYEKERYLIIMYGSEEGDYAKIPLPYGLNIFFNFGTAVSEMAYGVTSPLDGASFMLNSVFQSFSPVSISKGNSFGKSVMKTLTPTVLKPLTELTINEDYFGNRIYKEDFYFGADTPSSSRSDKNTAEWSKSMAEFLNSATGGNEFESGLIDWNPDAIEYMFTFMGGGTAKFMSRAGKAATKVAQGKTDEIEVNDVPFARLFMSSIRESEPAGRYYETRQELLKEKNKVKGALKAGKKMTPEMKKVDQMLSYEKKVQSEIRKLSKIEKAAMKIEDVDKREEALNKIRDRKIKVYQWFNSNYYRLMKQK